MSEYHIPVLLKQSVDALVTNPDGRYADATFGGGSHSREILSRLSAKGSLMAFDRDSDALANAPEDGRLTLIHNNFRFIRNYVRLDAWDNGGEVDDDNALLDGVLADLGVSSHQFDTADRGFSFRYSAELDMRMNAQGGKTAADVINSYTQQELERILRLFGEVDNARRVAQLIVEARSVAPVLTTDDLAKAIAPALPSFAEHKHLARIYQAFRIEVNDEMRSLEKFLKGASASLKKGGRLVVITYHSLEDRMVKNFIRSGNIDGVEQKDSFGVSLSPLKAVNRKPILPEDDEIANNTRARSAKLRIAEKYGRAMPSWKLADIRTFFKNSFVAVLKAELLMRTKVDKYLIHVLYLFFLIVLTIWISLRTEATMAKVEQNNKAITELEIYRSQMIYDLTAAEKRSAVEKRLGEMGSEVKSAKKPATVLK